MSPCMSPEVHEVEGSVELSSLFHSYCNNLTRTENLLQSPMWFQERMMMSFLLRREEEERVTSYSGRGESRISRMYYK